MQRSGLIRAGLVALGLPQLLIGLWAIVDTQGWFNSFPGPFASDWLPAYGGYNAHLALDVGATFVAIGGVMLLAAWWGEKRLVQAALIGYLLYDIPHFIYHLGADDALPTGDHIASDVTLAMTVGLGLVLLAMTRSGATSPRRAVVSGDARARIAPRTKGIFARTTSLYSRASYGSDVTPGGVFAHHPGLAMGYAGLEFAVEHTHRVDSKLKDLAAIRASQVVNCEWCMDFGSKIGRDHGVTDEQLTKMARYPESDAFTPLEKLVLDYASAASRTPADVDDELFAKLAEHFDEAQLVELTTAIAIENFRARFNHATGMVSQGFSEGMVCVVPEAPDTRTAGTPA